MTNITKLPAATKKTQKPKLPALTLKNLTDYGLPEQLATPLYEAVTLMRAGESATEAAFVAWLIHHNMPHASLEMVDAAGNVHFTVPCPDGSPSKSLFVAHTDTVHYQGGVNQVGFDAEGGYIHGVDEPLGADDGAGVAILCYMMHHQVPGRYIFTRQEESGGVGAKFLADSLPEVLRKYNKAVTFDRRGTSEVIITQGGSVCASAEFGEALADALNEQNLLYTTSDKGVYTDTKEFRGLISECVNVATGYYQEHGSSEHLDLQHFGLLAIAAVRIDWESLPTSRIPKKEKYSGYGTYLPSANLEDSMSPVEQWGGMDGVTDYEDQIFELEDAVHLAIAGNTSYLQITLTAQLAEITGVTFNECAKFVYVNKLKPEILEELDWGQSFETLADQMLIIAAPEIM